MLWLRTMAVVVLLAAAGMVQSAFAGGSSPHARREKLFSLKQLGRLFAEQRDPVMIQLRGEVEPGSSLVVRLLDQVKQITDARPIPDDGLPPMAVMADFRTALEVIQGKKKIEPVTKPEPVVEKPVAPPQPEVDYREDARATLKLTVVGSMKAADGADVVILKNGDILRAGETVQANYKGKTYRWTVTSVANGKIVLEKLE